MKKNRISILLGALLVAVIIGGFTSCNDSLDPIFYTLEQERPIVDDSLDNEITVRNVVKGGTWYFAAAPSIFYRATGSTTWEKANMPQTGVMCEAMEIFSGDSKLYAGFFSDSGATLTFRLYSATPGSSLIWSVESYGAPSVNNEQIVMLKDVNGTLLIGTKNGATYSLHGTAATYLTSLSGMPIDALHDGVTTYWIVAGSEVYQAATLAGLSTPLTTAPTLSAGASFGGIHYSTTLLHAYYLSTTDGRIWYSDNAGGSWTSSADMDVVFTKFIEVGTDLLVGTRTHGYYKVAGGDVTQMERQPHYSISDLYNGGVLNFALDGTTKVFACTAGAGLWRSEDSGDNWNRE